MIELSKLLNIQYLKSQDEVPKRPKEHLQIDSLNDSNKSSDSSSITTVDAKEIIFPSPEPVYLGHNNCLKKERVLSSFFKESFEAEHTIPPLNSEEAEQSLDIISIISDTTIKLDLDKKVTKNSNVKVVVLPMIEEAEKHVEKDDDKNEMEEILKQLGKSSQFYDDSKLSINYLRASSSKDLVRRKGINTIISETVTQFKVPQTPTTNRRVRRSVWSNFLGTTIKQPHGKLSAKRLSKQPLLKEDEIIEQRQDKEIPFTFTDNIEMKESIKLCEREYLKVLKNLKTVFSFHKLYFNIGAKGEYHEYFQHNYRSWRGSFLPNARSLWKPKAEVYHLKGDGIYDNRSMPDFLDFKMIVNKNSGDIVTCSYLKNFWMKEKFEPELLFPNFRKMCFISDPWSFIIMFHPLLKLVQDEIDNPRTFKEFLRVKNFRYQHDLLLNWKQDCYKDSGNFSRFIKPQIEAYILRFKNVKRLSIKRVEESILGDFENFFEMIHIPYLTAFHKLSKGSLKSKHNTKEIYVEMYHFYMKCPIVDYGYPFLKFCGITKYALLGLKDLDLSYMDSLSMISAIYQKRLSPGLSDHALCLLRLVIAFMNSCYFHGFILRRCLYFVDNKRYRKEEWSRNRFSRILQGIEKDLTNGLKKGPLEPEL